jgi:hypothetical protein
MEEAIANNDVGGFVTILMSYISSHNRRNTVIDVDSDKKVNDDATIEQLHRLKDLLQKGIAVINKNVNDITKLEASKASASSSGEVETYLVLDEAQFVEPRGKFKATISKGGLFLEGKQGSLFVNWSKIARSACIPNPQSSKKEGEDILVFALSEPVKINNKDITNFQWILNKSDKKVVEVTFNSNNMQGTEAAIIPKLMKYLSGKSVDIPRPDLFSSKSKEKPFLPCYKGIQEGFVFPLKSGVIFIKPLLYIPFNEIASVSAGRGGTQGVTRYIDLVIETADEKQYEFSNIDRDELPSLNNYVKNYLEERIRHENSLIKNNKVEETGDNDDGDNDDGDDDDDDDDDDSDEDDDDFDPDDNDSDEDGGSGSGSDSDDDDDGDNSKAKKNDSDAETVDEDAGKDSAKPAPKESRKTANPKKKAPTKEASKGSNPKKESRKSSSPKKKESRKSSSPKRIVVNNDAPIPKSMLGFVSLIETENDINSKRSLEIHDDDEDNLKKQKLA